VFYNNNPKLNFWGVISGASPLEMNMNNELLALSPKEAGALLI